MISSRLTFTSGYKFAKYGYRAHTYETSDPDGGYEAVGVVEGLPPARPQRMTDGVVSLHGDGHQSPRRYRHRTCWNNKNKIIIFDGCEQQLLHKRR